MKTEAVDSIPSLLALLGKLKTLPATPPSIYLDLEGINLGRDGSISIISLYVAPFKHTYLIDVYRLSDATFSTTDISGTSLKSILEAPHIPKVIFDVRSDSDALFSLHQISISGVKDLQLMELACRLGSRDFVFGLAKCIENHSPVPASTKAAWRRTKDRVSQMFDPKNGGRYEILNERPLRLEIVQNCQGDVSLLPGLYKVYSSKLAPPNEAFWRAKLDTATTERIKLSQSSNYVGQAKSNACGPWDEWTIEIDIDAWNDDIMLEALNGDDEDYGDYGDDFEDWYQDTARDCIGWEEDMEKNGEWY